MLKFGTELSDYKNKSIEELDSRAEKLRLAYVTAGVGQALVYITKLAEAENYLALGDENAQVSPYEYPHLHRESIIDDMTIFQKARQIVTMAYEWKQVSAIIDAKRLKIKQSIDAATTASEVRDLLCFDWDSLVA